MNWKEAQRLLLYDQIHALASQITEDLVVPCYKQEKYYANSRELFCEVCAEAWLGMETAAWAVEGGITESFLVETNEIPFCAHCELKLRYVPHPILARKVLEWVTRMINEGREVPALVWFDVAQALATPGYGDKARQNFENAIYIHKVDLDIKLDLGTLGDRSHGLDNYVSDL